MPAILYFVFMWNSYLSIDNDRNQNISQHPPKKILQMIHIQQYKARIQFPK